MDYINNDENNNKFENHDIKNYILVGRPNVGKSSIFNFLIKKNEAIVRDEDGTTQDWRSKKIGNITLWDTPGIFKLEELPPCKVDKIFFVIENNVIDYDRKLFIELKRKFDVVVIVNKIDLEKSMYHSENFSFFGEVLKISLKSRIGLHVLADTFFEDYVNIQEDEKKTWAIIGKPNVGKSSLVNLLAKKYVNKVADYNGTTKEFLPVHIDEKILLDTPGQRRRALFPRYENIFGIIFVIDLKQERQDLRLIGMTVDRRKPIIIVINKIDLAKKDEVKKVEDSIKKFWDIPIIKMSCLRKKGFNSILENIELIEENFYKRIKTAQLNAWLNAEIKSVEPRLKFISQIEVGPPRFFVDFKLEDHKERMLKRRLAKKFGFEGVNIEIRYKEPEFRPKPIQSDKKIKRKK
jgi:GTP-binding protein